jgi:hypothetical protein
MKHPIKAGLCLLWVFFAVTMLAQTPVPNGDFENWTSYGSYENPTGWDTPNEAIQIGIPLGTKVVTKSTDHESGTYSARLESKHLTFPTVTVPGALTLGHFTLDIFAQTFTVDGGVPITDLPTHLKGFYKYYPQGGDSCAIGIGLTKWNNGVRDSVGVGSFSTLNTVNVWTPFSAWINYMLTEQPDTFNIIAISSADSMPTTGTVLFVDNLYLDYTVGINPRDPAAGIDIYQDRELKQILVYFDLPVAEATETRFYNMTGQVVNSTPVKNIDKDRLIFSYQGLSSGIYILEILHGGKKYCRKFFITS